MHALENLNDKPITFYNQAFSPSMKHFFVIVFSRFLVVLKDDFSAMAVLAYFLSLNVFTIIGYYKIVFQHSCLSDVPLFYALIIMLIVGLFTHYVLLKKLNAPRFLKDIDSSPIYKSSIGKWITLVYMTVSFTLMLIVV
jgi:hypothetical protein